MKKGVVVAVNISDKKGIIKTPIPEGRFIEEFGLENDAHAGPWHRQVSLLAVESIEKMKEKAREKSVDMKVELSEGKFAENITTKGISLHSLPVGTKLRIGETIQQVTQIGKECHTGCAIKNQVGECIMPREGIFTRVLKGGVVKPGDEIEVIE